MPTNSLRSSIDLLSLISFTDWVVFFSILGLTLAFVVYGNKRDSKKSTESDANALDYLLMSRTLTLPLFVATLVATWYGGIFGVTQIAFENGIYNFLTQGVFWYLTYLIFAFFLVKEARKFNVGTLPELVGRMFGRRSRFLAGIFNFFNVVPIAYVISLGIFLQSLFGLSLISGMFFGVCFVLLYSASGGLRSVVFSDLLQFVVMCSSVAIVAIVSVYSFGGIDFLRSHLPASHFDPTGGMGWGTTLVWGLIALSTLVDPNFYNRVFAADSERTAKIGILVSTGIWILFDISTTAGAMYARALLPGADSGQAYLIYAVQIMPDGLRGFFLAGILATVFSTIDSYLFIAGTTLSHDMLPGRFRDRKWVMVFSTVGVGLLAVIMASIFDGKVRLVWKALGSYSAACLLFPVLWGYIFPNRIRDNQFVAICLLGVVTTSYWKLVEHSGFWANVDEIYIGSATTFFGMLFAVGINSWSAKCQS